MSFDDFKNTVQSLESLGFHLDGVFQEWDYGVYCFRNKFPNQPIEVDFNLGTFKVSIAKDWESLVYFGKGETLEGAMLDAKSKMIG